MEELLLLQGQQCARPVGDLTCCHDAGLDLAFSVCVYVCVSVCERGDAESRGLVQKITVTCFAVSSLMRPAPG